MLKVNPLVQLKNLIVDKTYDIRQDLLGKTLTIIDASISDIEQRKAIKDLIRESMWGSAHFRWTSTIIGNIILEFAGKFTDLKMDDNDYKFLKEGIYSDSILPNSPPEKEYFNKEEKED